MSSCPKVECPDATLYHSAVASRVYIVYGVLGDGPYVALAVFRHVCNAVFRHALVSGSIVTALETLAVVSYVTDSVLLCIEPHTPIREQVFPIDTVGIAFASVVGEGAFAQFQAFYVVSGCRYP